MIALILAGLVPFLESSLFASGLHAVLAALGIQGKSEAAIDTATSDIADAVKSGMDLYAAVENIRLDSKLDHSHALAAGAAAVGVLAKQGIDIDHSGKMVSGVTPAAALAHAN